MAVMPRESWTDARLDDFRGEVNRRFDGVDMRLAEIREEFQRIHDRLDALYSLMVRGMVAYGVGIFGTLIAFMLQH